MKTAEEYWKAFPKHKPAKDADIAEAMREYAKLYASEAIREKDKEIEQLKAKQTKCELSNSDIFSWLQSKKFQTEKGEQEYSMYFDVDMPKIIRAAIDELSGKTEPFTGPVV